MSTANRIKTVGLSVLVIVLVFSLSTCRNPLLAAIDQAVTIAVTPPEIISVFPAVDAGNVAINSRIISVEFSKAIKADTVKSPNITIHHINTELETVYLTGSWAVNNNTVTFTANTDLSYATVYTITVGTGLLDTDGKSLSAGFDWSFTTGIAPDTDDPIIASVLVNNGALWANSLTVDLVIDASDNYDTDESTSIAQMNINSNGWVPFDPAPSLALSAGEGARVISVVVRDGSGNISSVASDTILVDTIPPIIDTFFLNGDKAATNSLDLSAYITAHDVGAGGSGVVTYQFRNSLDEWAGTWNNLDSGSMTLSGIALPSTSKNDDMYAFESIVRDLAGNESLASSKTIRYDLLPPGLISKNPDNQANNIPSNATVVTLIFNDSIDINSLNASTLVVNKNGSPLSGNYVLTDYNNIPKSMLQLTGLALSKDSDYIATLSPTITDVAGNQYGSTTNWYFHTVSTLDTSAPTGSIVPDLFETPLPGGSFAVNTNVLTMNIEAEDDYNSVYGMRIWGQGSLPAFEDSSSWEAFAPTKAWTLGATEKAYSLLYRLMDSAGNISPNPIQVKVIYDTTAPAVTSFKLMNGTTHFNNPQGIVTLLVDAVDSGVGIKQIKYSNDSNLDDDVWEGWSPIRENWTVDTGSEGTKTIYLSIRDYLDTTYTTVTPLSVVWDTTAPTITFSENDHIATNTAIPLTGTFTDTNGIASHSWSQENGPGTVSFSSTTVALPTVSASQDGLYVLRLTVRDDAGNESTSTVPFTWDTVAPDAMGSITTSGTYSTSKRPTISWAPVDGADNYLVVINGGAGVAVETTSYTPSADLPEGSNSFNVTPRDKAGNTANSSTASIIVDTMAPAITNNGVTFLLNATAEIVGSTSDAGSGLASTNWSTISGPGTVTFSAPSSATSNVTASQHGYYGLRLTVADNAGNVSMGNYTLNWDTVPPNAPTVTGIARTPNTQPTWSWSSGGNGGEGLYQYRLTRKSDASVYVDWTTYAATTSFTAPSLPGDPIGDDEGGRYSYILEVREKDAAGNESLVSPSPIWVDATFTAPPEVIVVGASIQNTTSITWNWSTGAAQIGTVSYRYLVQKNNTTVPATPPFDSLSWINSSTGTPILTATYPATTEAGADETWTILVEEKSLALGTWNGKLGSHTVRVDRNGPVAPTVTNVSSNPTNDSTPTWQWTSNAGSDGTGSFQYKIDNGEWTSTTSTVATALSALTDGNHTLYVQEKDALGNWGTSGTKVISVDLTAPTLTSIALNSGAGYTSSTTVTATITAMAESGMQMSFYDYNPAGWKAWEAYNTTKTIYLPSGEGSKNVYVKVRDALGNESAIVYDSITVDQTPPANLTLNLNAGATYTPSLDVYLDTSATDNLSPSSDWEIRYYYNGVYSNWLAYNAHTLADVNFTPVAGSKGVYVWLRDPAGNISSSAYDSIILQVPSPTFAYKGLYPTGNTYVFYNPVTEDSGPAVTQYEIAYATVPNANPNSSPASVVSAGSSTSTSYRYVTIPKGQLLYFFVRANNPDTGGYGAYSSTSVLGFSSNITIVYDQGDLTDEALAAKIKAIVEDTILSGRSIVDGTTIKGSMPVWTATLLPEDLVNNLTYNSQDNIYGNPVILTHGLTLADRQSIFDVRIRNLIAHGRGVMAIGNGNIAIDRVNANWTAWGLSGTRPAAIGYLNTASLAYTQGATFRPASTSESIWWTPVYNNYIYTNMGTETSVLANVFTAGTGRHGVYLSSGAPVDGAIYAGDASASTYYPVVRQGRFLTYGFFDATRNTTSSTTYEYGLPFFVNLIARMDNY